MLRNVEANTPELVSSPATSTNMPSGPSSISTRRSPPVSSPFVRRHRGTRKCCLLRNVTSVAPKADCEIHDSLSINRCNRRFETNIADNSLLRRSASSAQLYVRQYTIRTQCALRIYVTTNVFVR